MLSYVDLKQFFVVHMPYTWAVHPTGSYVPIYLHVFFPLFWSCAICRSTVVLFFLIGVSDFDLSVLRCIDGYIAIYTPVK